MKLTLGFSPCPNDTFIFDALVNGNIDTEDIQYEPILDDVETLNRWALKGKLSVSKVSYGVVPQILPQYNMLESGGAMGMGVGPLLITTPKNVSLSEEQLNQLPIAIPGENTTAHVLLSFAFPHLQKKVFTVFNQIEEAVLSGTVAAGVIIHENRFTYQDKGLVLIKDLGQYWEDQLSSPIPLGGIAIQKKITPEIKGKVNQHIAASITKAWQQYPILSSYVVKHAQEMSEQVMRQHIQLYVNDFSISAGDVGKKAVNTFLSVYSELRGMHIPEAATIFI